MRVSMMLVLVSAVMAMAMACGPDAPEPAADAGSVAGSSGSGGSEAVGCDDAACSAKCAYSCGESGSCVAVDGGAPACSYDCK